MAHLVDTHSHLQFPDYADDLDEVISRAKSNGIGTIVVVGTSLSMSRKAIEIARDNDILYATVGIHPHDAENMSEKDWQDFLELVKAPKVIAIGETGLDYFKNISSEEVQKRCFEKQISIAKEYNKPIVLHIREAFGEVIKILKEYHHNCRGIAHCFSGTTKDANELISMGFYITFTANITYPGKRSNYLREVLKEIPIEFLMLETDCPYLPPQSKRGKRNEPAYILETYQVAAQLRQMPLDKFIDNLYANFTRLFF